MIYAYKYYIVNHKVTYLHIYYMEKHNKYNYL